MADNVTGPTILQQNDNRVTISAVVQSDGSGSTTIMGDVSALAANNLGQAVARISIQANIEMLKQENHEELLTLLAL